MNKTLISLSFDKEQMLLSLNFKIWPIIVVAGIAILIVFITRLVRNRHSVNQEIVPVKIAYSYGGIEVEYEIVRDYSNIEIAHRMLVELTTRKAAIPIDEEDDLIIEVYDSWYALFELTRSDLKGFTGDLLLKNNTSKEIVRLLTDILNKGLRPHLTKYQAAFRKWYQEQISIDEHKGLRPQEIQKRYPEYKQLIESIKEVNEILQNYKSQLELIIC